MRRWVVRPVDDETDEEVGQTPHASREAALVAALADAEPGETILVHAADCNPCSCTPQTFLVPKRVVL